ncbi:MAG TPA: glycine betaine ABC transporter substrate-binding protein [Bacteroidales bacterium]|nr:glycine betaine ABC transporter substrate-binding protein [Bacteroidales bacterium]
MKMKFRKISGLLLVAVMVLSVVSCNNKKSSSSEETKEKITILYPNWAEGIAFTHLAKVALEDNNYEVELINLEPGLIYGELSKDDAKGDVCLDAWLPNTHADYWAKYGDNINKIGESFSNGTTGLVVPSYVDINSISELNAHKEKFDGEIIGIGSGAGIHKNTLKAIEEYDLDFEQITSSGAAMVASLEKSIRDNEWTVITGWKPHYKWAQFDIKYLEDPKGIYPKDVCAIISRRGFETDHPEVEDFFNNFNFNEEELYSLLDAIKTTSEETGAKQWYKENKELVQSWWN